MDKKNLLKSKSEINGYEFAYEVAYGMIMLNKVCKDDPRCDLRTYMELVLTALFDPESCEKVTEEATKGMAVTDLIRDATESIAKEMMKD